MAAHFGSPANAWSAAMDEGSSPWDDVPSRSHANHEESAASPPASASASAPACGMPPYEPWGPAENNHGDPRHTADPSAPPPPNLSQPVPNIAAGAKPAPSKTRRGRGHVTLTQSTTLERLDDSMGPLGPLGADPVEAPPPSVPAPLTKELASRTRPAGASRPSTAASGGSSRSPDLDDHASLNARPRVPPPVQPASFDGRARPAQPSQPVEQAAKPTFHVTVGDPHTVGNAASSHTVYSVITNTTSKAYMNPNMTVTRRYRDFLWLYERLHDNNPGVVVPPPPEKQAVGRFDTNFIESRRMALERMMNKIAGHPVLQMDGDLKTFLESESFNVAIKHSGKDPLLGGNESKGIMSSIGLGASSSGKFIEHDDWFHDRRIYLDALENQLKALQKSTDTVVGQRKALAESCFDFSASLHNLAAVELSPSLSGPLDTLGDLQLRIQELYQRQALQDILTLGIVIDEYIRLIGSVKKAFEQRQKASHSWHSAEQKLQDIKKQHEKLMRAGRSQQDRIGQMQADVADAERRVHASRLLFEDMGRLMRTELDRFEREKVEDFKSGVETFLESAIEAQKELIELWETYLLQLDSDEDGPPLIPAGVIADPDPKSDAQLRREANTAQLDADDAEERETRLSGTTVRDSEDFARDSEDTVHDEARAAALHTAEMES